MDAPSESGRVFTFSAAERPQPAGRQCPGRSGGRRAAEEDGCENRL